MDFITVTDPKGNVTRYVGSFDRPTNTISKIDGGNVYLSERDRIETEPLAAIIVVLVVLFIIFALLV